jgi:FAD/FMN-containing dehydrogenase
MAVHREMTPSGLELSGLDGGTVCVTWEELESLSRLLGGRLLSSGDDGWGEAVLVWNAMAARVPALVVQPASSADVSATVTFARERGLLLSVKGGGHHIAGTSIAEGGLTLDMSRMHDVEVDPTARRARVGPGALLQDVDRATQEHGLATVLGFISEVGVAGLTLGGGLGYLTRRFGWGVDNLEEVEIVTADGEIRIASRDEHADLFWAVRGGGGNFGVVTRFTFRLHDVGPVVYGGLVAWPFDRAEEVLDAYRTITTNAPRELSVWMVMLHAPPLPFVPEEFHGEKTCTMVVCYSGDLADMEEALAPIRAIPDPVVEQLQAWPYAQQQSFLDDSEPKGADNYWRTEYVSELTDELLGAVRDVFAECEIPEAQVGFLHLGGALNERSDDDGAVGNRDAQYACGVNGRWEHDDPNADAFQRWVREGSARVRRFTLGRTYVNFQSADEGDERTRASYGKNYERLALIKATYDPTNLFRVNRNIAPQM